MNDVTEVGWFYTKEAEKIGPVSFADLRVLVAESALNPRLDLVWSQGMDSWKPAGEIEGLFDRSVVDSGSLGPKVENPYVSPTSENQALGPQTETDWPGARRRSYLIATLIFPFILTFVIAAVTPFLAGQLGAEGVKTATMVGNFLPIPIYIYFTLARLQNLGMSRWWFFGNLVPLLNFWVGYRTFACPAGYHAHRKLDGAGIALAIVYWLLIVVVLLAIAAFFAVIGGAIQSPELQEQFREILETVEKTQ